MSNHRHDAGHASGVIDMGDIVEFREFGSKRRTSAHDVPAEGAQVLFFLGVRYERHEVVEAPPKAARKRRPPSTTTLGKEARPAGSKRKTTRQRA